MNAQKVLSQINSNNNVLDQSQSAHAHRSTLLMDTAVWNAQTTKLLTQLTIRDV